MAYRKDPDLEFLSNVPSKELDPLVQILIQKGGITASLTTHHRSDWHLIAEEIQRFGANTLATTIRGGEGVLYREPRQQNLWVGSGSGRSPSV